MAIATRPHLMQPFDVCQMYVFSAPVLGLVMVVKDHETIRLKMLFTQKKKIENDNKQLRAERENYKVLYF
ncbi:hypothetical protein DPMN_012689 [Dreissena polymorpha]|uniref:Uncharacterized protein n=1 Tax=Dreissena polymorpha TaxID=45954 RepID=A0A9D4N7H5_DREPO|nr:hypothetical protein DPMN_012689 [Dreissena polymorpha]